MPFTHQEISDAGKIGLDHYVRNEPIDQVALDRELFKRLVAGKQFTPGGKQYIVEQLRLRYSSNFQWFNGGQVVTYNKRQTIEQASFAWRSAHDGLALEEDRLIQNGITVTDSGPGGNASDSELLQLTNLLKEQMAVMKLGFQEKFSLDLHRDGTHSADAITGLDGLVTTTAGGTVGLLSRVTYPVWDNHRALGLSTTTTTGTILNSMEIGWRACVKNGGRPDFIPVGSDFADGFRQYMLLTYGAGGGMSYPNTPFGKRVEAGTDVFTFHGVDMVWCPEFEDLQALTGAATSWIKRCYFLNLKSHMRLRPIQGQHMITRKPPRAYDKYEWYWGLTWRGALTVNRGNAHAVFSVS